MYAQYSHCPFLLYLFYNKQTFSSLFFPIMLVWTLTSKTRLDLSLTNEDGGTGATWKCWLPDKSYCVTGEYMVLGVDSFPGYYGPQVTNSTTIAPVPADAVPAPKDGSTTYSCVMSIKDQSVPPDYYGCQVPPPTFFFFFRLLFSCSDIFSFFPHQLFPLPSFLHLFAFLYSSSVL